MARRLHAVATEVGGRSLGGDAEFGEVTTDTRTLTRGALFVAISGERYDGNDFVPDAQAKGAAGALVSRVSTAPLPQIKVDDTKLAFGVMARAWRDNFLLPVIAVTGSAGKTTVKEMVASIVRVTRRLCVTEGNLNNDIGVPLTLMRVGPDDQALVVELGANHVGEIDYLSRMVKPDIGIITNAAAAHLQGFGSLAAVAQAKGELLDHLSPAGTAVLNADDAFCADWAARAGDRSILTFGLNADADCRCIGEPRYTASGSALTMRLPDDQRIEIDLPLPGRQNIANALAAAAAAFAIGTPAAQIAEGLARTRSVSGRLVRVPGAGGATLVDDSYNANPASARAALDYLAGLKGRRVLVLGNMAELGDEELSLHREIGEYARGRCDDLIAIGGLAAEAAAGFGPAGRAFDDIDAAAEALQGMLGADVTILIKGSRVMGLDRLVASLRAPRDEEAATC